MDGLSGVLPESLSLLFEPVREAGKGAMGRVVVARDRRLDRLVAVKLVRDPGDPAAVARFLAEARGLVRIRHPGVVTAFDAGETSEGPYLVMEYLEGSSLEALSPVEDPLAALLPVAAALDAVHAAGLVHRDLKPANVIRTGDGRSVLIDFGLLRDLRRETVTATGKVAGTLVFMAPETLAGQRPGPASDWYGFGATLFAIAEGRPPFRHEQVVARLTVDVVPSLEFERLDPEGPEARVIRACLAEDPEARPRSSAEIAGLAARGGPPPSRRESGRHARHVSTPVPVAGSRRVPWGGLAVGLLLAAGSGSLLLRPSGPGTPGPAQAASPGPTGQPPPPAPDDPTRLEPLPPGPRGHARFRNPVDGIAMVRIPSGRLASRHGGEHALAGFLLAETEVPVEAFDRFLAMTGHPEPSRWSLQMRRPRAPVVLVTAEDAEAYCDWAGGRLPSPLEWEWAAGGSDGRRFPWGNQPPRPELARYGTGDPLAALDVFREIQDVGGRPEGMSPFGVLDMAGNVAEWSTHPEGRAHGGSYFTSASEVAIASFKGWARDTPGPALGFRCAMDDPG